MSRINRLLCLAVLCCWSALSLAQGFQPSPEQIQQFQSLSPQQQRQLAESMGIDVEAMIRQQTGGSANFGESATTADPRGRQQPMINGAQSDQLGGLLGSFSQSGALQYHDIRELREQYRSLSLEEFNHLYEAMYSDLPRRQFIEIYRQITGQEWEDKDELKMFGYDLFGIGPEAFMPPSNVPVPADYVIGPGDMLVVQLYGKENNTLNLTVSREGQIQFPNIGPINLAGLTFSQARDVIANTVSEQMIGVKSSVTMGPLRTIRVFVLGEAFQPGSYTVSSLSTMTNALFASGGITRVGSLRDIQLKRDGKVVTHLDVYDLLLHGDTSADSRLLPGDVIFVPPVGDTVSVTGEVKRPAIYELKNEDTVAEVIALAGGYTSDAHPDLTRLQRVNQSGEKSLINLDLTQASDRNYPVEDADTIDVASILENVEDAITLKGHVKRPGIYSWREGLRFSDLVPSVEQLKSNPDLNSALIKREIPATKQIEIRVFSPRQAWLNEGSEEDPLLRERDTVFVFDFETDRSEALQEVLQDLQVQSRYQEREKTVSVSGSVRFPGNYPLAEGMTAQELVALAGGLTASALGNEAEITRYDIDENRQRVVVHIPIDLQAPAQKLQPGDTLRVKQIPLWTKKETVEITGEVMFPGTYTILPGETLTQVLERAGGLTRHAYPRGAIFSRADLRELEQQRLLDLREKLEADIAALNVQEGITGQDIEDAEAQRLLSNLSEVKAVGRMVIDLPQILESPLAYDFQLEDGDTLSIPQFSPSVTVVGEVQYPTSHFYDHTLDVYDYISRSGGTKENADAERIYIVKANGQVVLPSQSAWFRKERNQIQPGDTIIVPIDADRVDPISLWSSVTQIMYQAALGIAAISSL